MARTCPRLANGLLGLGLAKGDRVALLAYNCVEWLELYVALARAGLVTVPINFRLTPPEIAYIVQHSEAQRLHRAGRTGRRRRGHPGELDPLPRRHFGASASARSGLDRLRGADRRGLGRPTPAWRWGPPTRAR